MAKPEIYSPRVTRKRCDEPPSPLLMKGIDEFNRGLFFEAHETWEEEWLSETGPQRDLIRGLIHIAAGYVHLTRKRNPTGAFIKLGSGARLLDRFGRRCRGIELDRLRRGARLDRDRVLLLGRERLLEFDVGGIGKIGLAVTAEPQA